MNIYKFPLGTVYPIAFIGKRFPRFMVNFRQWLKTKHRINWKNPQNMQEYVYAQLFDKKTDLNLFGLVADKYEVREYIKKQIGEQYLNEIYGAWENANDINFSELPEKFVLKTNNGCATNIFIKNKHNINESLIKKTLNNWLKFPYGDATGQIHYSRIKPMIIAEKFMQQSKIASTNELIDYKFHCINGKPVNILVCTNRSERSHAFDAMVFNMNWEKLPNFVSPQFSQIQNMEKPVSFEEMKKVVAKLAEPFKFARIDFYEIDGHPIFGEITMTPNMGGALSEFADQQILHMLLNRPK